MWKRTFDEYCIHYDCMLRVLSEKYIAKCISTLIINDNTPDRTLTVLVMACVKLSKKSPTALVVGNVHTSMNINSRVYLFLFVFCKKYNSFTLIVLTLKQIHRSIVLSLKNEQSFLYCKACKSISSGYFSNY